MLSTDERNNSAGDSFPKHGTRWEGLRPPLFLIGSRGRSISSQSRRFPARRCLLKWPHHRDPSTEAVQTIGTPPVGAAQCKRSFVEEALRSRQALTTRGHLGRSLESGRGGLALGIFLAIGPGAPLDRRAGIWSVSLNATAASGPKRPAGSGSLLPIFQAEVGLQSPLSVAIWAQDSSDPSARRCCLHYASAAGTAEARGWRIRPRASKGPWSQSRAQTT